MKDQKGFTLIEIIVSLIAIGLILTTGGMVVTHAISVYMFTKQNAATSQKTDYALSRMTAELLTSTDITVATPTEVQFYTTAGDLDGNLRTISVTTDSITLNNNLLLDNVATDTKFSYRKFDGSDWVAGTDNFSQLAAIDVDISIENSDISEARFNFSTSITMRNNGIPNAPVPGV